MRLEHWWQDWNLQELFQSYLPDFILSFTFFTSIFYAVLGKRLETQRPAIAMSAAMGFALSVGLVWWERANELSIVNLGPLAIGFAVLILAFVMYQCIRQIGGSWAGAGIAIGASIIIAQILKLPVPFDPQIIQTVVVVTLIVGILAFALHRQSFHSSVPHTRTEVPKVKHDIANLFRERHLSGKLHKGLRKLRKQAKGTKEINEHPEERGDIIQQLKKMLPAEGYLTERMAGLRMKAHQARNGHIARMEETRHAFSQLPTSAKKKASAELAARYSQMVGIDTRLERLDKAVAENEKRIRELTEKAREYTARYDHRKLVETLKAAEKLQHHNSRLFKLIEKTERELSAVAKTIAKEVKHYEKAE